MAKKVHLTQDGQTVGIEEQKRQILLLQQEIKRKDEELERLNRLIAERDMAIDALRKYQETLEMCLKGLKAEAKELKGLQGDITDNPPKKIKIIVVTKSATPEKLSKYMVTPDGAVKKDK